MYIRLGFIVPSLLLQEKQSLVEPSLFVLTAKPAQERPDPGAEDKADEQENKTYSNVQAISLVGVIGP
jgi:hypothetical protein